MPEPGMTIPKEIRGQKYISLTTFRKNGAAVNTPVWFAEQGERLYVKTRSDSGKYKRIRNSPQIKVAACTIRGKITGPEFSATTRMLAIGQWPDAQKALNRKYWLARLPFWSKKNVFVEIEIV
jgi:PPOX class probable F420-dependent enzyme